MQFVLRPLIVLSLMLLSAGPGLTQSLNFEEAPAVRALPLKRYAFSRQVQQDAEGFYYQPMGLCEDYPEESTTLARVRQDFATLRELGVKQLRFAFGWDGIEKQPGVYDWGFWDDFVKLAQQYGISLIPYVCYSPEWANQGGSDFWRTPPDQLKRFGDFMKVIVNRYKASIQSWELWNEPDLEAYWLGNSAQFAEMIKYAAQQVRVADPHAVIVLGGMSRGRGPFFDSLIQQHGLDKYVDVLNLHGYHETWHPATTEQYPEQIRHFGAILSQGPHQPELWLAEFGYSNWRFSATSVSQWGIDAIYAYEHTARYQAIALLKQHVMAQASGQLSLSAWYRLRDLPLSEGVIGDDNNKYLGLLDLQGKPKPAYHAMKLVTKLFDAPTRRITEQVSLQGPSPSQAVVEVFQKRDGKLILAAWLRSSKRDEVTDKSGRASDTRSETFNLELPALTGAVKGKVYKRLQAYNLLGEMVPPQGWLDKNTLRGISLKGGEIFMAELSP